MTIKGPAIFLAQFAGDKEPFNSLENITKQKDEFKKYIQTKAEELIKSRDSKDVSDK